MANALPAAQQALAPRHRTDTAEDFARRAAAARHATACARIREWVHSGNLALVLALVVLGVLCLADNLVQAGPVLTPAAGVSARVFSHQQPALTGVWHLSRMVQVHPRPRLAVSNWRKFTCNQWIAPPSRWRWRGWR
jgi:hypothetical protein